ncbi:MAG: Rrf2 family transcriptional regulator [Firmicutes bacterium]|nr:Rrf2 family transcriptional regulator [Bacillota bacterium]
MQITRQTEYAVKILMELASHPFGQMVSSRSIAENKQIPEHFLQKTIQLLVKAGMVTSQKGRGGGVRLVRPGDEFTIYDVLVAIEGPLAINVCLKQFYECPNLKTCRVRKLFGEAQNALFDVLNGKTIAELVNENE